MCYYCFCFEFCFVSLYLAHFKLNFLALTHTHMHMAWLWLWLWLPTHTFRARVKWMRNVIILSTVSLSIIEWVTEKHTATNMPNWFAFLWPTKEFLQAIIQGSYQLCLIWFDIVFIAIVATVLLGKSIVSSLFAIRSMNFEKCATENGS